MIEGMDGWIGQDIERMGGDGQAICSDDPSCSHARGTEMVRSGYRGSRVSRCCISGDPMLARLKVGKNWLRVQLIMIDT